MEGLDFPFPFAAEPTLPEDFLVYQVRKRPRSRHSSASSSAEFGTPPEPPPEHLEEVGGPPEDPEPPEIALPLPGGGEPPEEDEGDPLLPAAGADMGEVAALRDALTEAFTNLRRDFAYPVPQFSGKKGEKPENHCLKVEDWYNHFAIPDGNKVERFKETLTGKAREWYNGLAPVPGAYAGDNNLRAQFCTRWSLKGKTPSALYAQWQNLSFDPGTEDIEDFLSDVKEIATQLGYPDAAQVMAIKQCMPLEVHSCCLNMNDLGELKTFVITVFDNPRLKKQYSSKEKDSAKTSANPFAQMEDGPSASYSSMTATGKQSTSYVAPTIELGPESLQALRSEVQNWKPHAAPKNRGRGNRGQNNYKGNKPQGNQGQGYQRNGRQNNYQGQQSSHQSSQSSRGNSRGNRQGGRGRGRDQRSQGQRFDRSPNESKSRVASKTPDKDKRRCYYCQEHGHFIRECPAKARDEGGAPQYNLFTIVEDEEEYEESPYLDQYDDPDYEGTGYYPHDDLNP